MSVTESDVWKRAVMAIKETMLKFGCRAFLPNFYSPFLFWLGRAAHSLCTLDKENLVDFKSHPPRNFWRLWSLIGFYLNIRTIKLSFGSLNESGEKVLGFVCSCCVVVFMCEGRPIEPFAQSLPGNKAEASAAKLKFVSVWQTWMLVSQHGRKGGLHPGQVTSPLQSHNVKLLFLNGPSVCCNSISQLAKVLREIFFSSYCPNLIFVSFV